MQDITIYDECPIYTSDHFQLRLVEMGDAEDLLSCYSDELAVQLMNADNCTSDFHYETLNEMNDCIRGWLGGYKGRNIVRFSIIDTENSKAIGTIEMYSKTKKVGILRLDLRSDYEMQENILELLRLSVEGFYDAFGVQHIMTKAIPIAVERISALRAYDFIPDDHNTVMPHDNYYIHRRCQEILESRRTDAVG